MMAMHMLRLVSGLDRRLMRAGCVCGMTLIMSACDNSAPAEPDIGATGTAKGEILPGSVSDAMIPLSELRSQGSPVASDGEESAMGKQGATGRQGRMTPSPPTQSDPGVAAPIAPAGQNIGASPATETGQTAPAIDSSAGQPTEQTQAIQGPPDTDNSDAGNGD